MAEPQCHAVEADLFERLVLVPGDSLLELGQRLMLRCAEDADENPLFALIGPLDGQGAVHPWVLVQPRPGEFEQRPPQGGVLCADQGVGLHEQARPRRPGRVPHPRLGERGHIERPADGRRRDSMREMHQIADESPRSGERKISPFRFVHPCTSRGLRRRKLSNDAHNSMLRGAGSTRVDSTRPGESKPTGNRVGGEGEACKNESRTGSAPVERGSRMAWPDRVARR